MRRWKEEEVPDARSRVMVGDQIEFADGTDGEVTRIDACHGFVEAIVVRVASGEEREI